MFESLIEHALINKLRRLPWQRSMWVGDFRPFTASFSKVCGYRRPHVSDFVTFLKVSNLETVFKSFHFGERFQKFAVTVCVFPGYVWTKAGSVTNVCGYKQIQTRIHRASMFVRLRPHISGIRLYPQIVKEAEVITFSRGKSILLLNCSLDVQ